MPTILLDRNAGLYTADHVHAAELAPRDYRTVDRWAVLAGVRFFLAATVLAVHLQYVVDQSAFWWKPVTTYSAFGSVVAFLFVSGYSIGHSYRRQPKGFYARRFWRIYPVYLACLILCLAPFALAEGNFICLNGQAVVKEPLMGWISAAFLGQGFWLRGLFVYNTAWSLSIEAFFYLLAPLFARCGSKWLLGIVFLSGLTFSACRLLGLHPAGVTMYGFPAFAYVWVWLLGFIYFRHEDSTWAKALTVLVMPVLAPGLSTSLVAGAILFWKAIRLKPWHRRLLTYLGDISYPLYLAHFPVIFALYAGYKFQSSWIYFLASLACAMLLHHLVEAPVNFLRNRFEKAAMKKQAALT